MKIWQSTFELSSENKIYKNAVSTNKQHTYYFASSPYSMCFLVYFSFFFLIRLLETMEILVPRKIQKL